MPLFKSLTVTKRGKNSFTEFKGTALFMYIRFDEFSINTQQFELILGEQSRLIDERICSLFTLLVENYPNHCNKQVCLMHVWPDTVVSDMSLSKLVSDTRKIFKNAGCEVAIIQTVHGRGYRLSQELGKQLLSQISSISTEAYRTDSVYQKPRSSITSNSLPSSVEGCDGVDAADLLASNSDNDSGKLEAKAGDEKTPLIVVKKLPILLRIKNKLERITYEWPRSTTVFLSILVSSIVLLTLLSTHLLDPLLISSHSAIDENEIVYSERADAIGRVLWIDDHPENNSKEREVLRSRNIGVYSTTNSKEALLLVELYHYDLIISDMGREEDAIAGLKLLESMRADGIFIPYYIYTLNATEKLKTQVSLSGGQGVAVDSDDLFQQIMINFK